MRIALVAILLAIGAMLISSAQGSGRNSGGSPFEWRGVIQGQYGPQFNASERRRLLRFMSRNGFNVYVHAPKGDPYQRLLWRQPYPGVRQAQLDAEVRLASRLGIEWIPNVSPAAAAWSSPGEKLPEAIAASAPVCFSSQADLRQLLAKLEPFRAAGSGAFMVSFDDVKRGFSCAADSAAYGDGDRAFGFANADLLNRLHTELLARDPSARLFTVTADYMGTRDSEYLRGFRQRLAAGIEVMWTGSAVQSRPFRPAEADAYARLVGREPVIWENWTANDALSLDDDRPDRVFLGPYARRPRVAGHVGGFFFNPANQPDLNFLPLATAGSWMRHPARYRPRLAFLHATRRLAGRGARALRAFAETSYSTTLRGGVEAPTLRWRIGRFLHARPGTPARRRAASRLRRQLKLVVSARSRLLRVGRLRHFVHQARPFLRSARLNARAGLIATDLLQARGADLRRQLRQRLRRVRRRAARSPSETFGTRVGLYGMTGNVIDSYLARVHHQVRHRR